jgi:two-component system cell cycle sensor histidine kinase/response regulator CckA
VPFWRGRDASTGEAYAGAMGGLDERAVFEKGPVVLFKWQNRPGWPVEEVTSNVVDVLGYTAREFLDGEVAYSAIVHPDDLGRVASEVAAAASSREASFAHEPYRVTRRDGCVRWLYDYTHVLRGDDGVPTHFLGYVFDVTSRIEAEAEKQELERRFLHAQKLESLGVLAGGVAHDFNNLLTSIGGQAELVRLALRDRDWERAGRCLDRVDLLTKRAADLTRQLLTYTGRGSFVVEPVELGALVDELTDILSVALSKKAALVRRFEAHLPKVRGDRAQLQQVLMNLLTNASEALGDEPGSVVLSTRALTCDLDALRGWGAPELEPGRYVELEVTDTGVGMSDETKGRLFEPFFSTKFPGRGLGMSAVLGIVRGHGGAVRVESELGRGTSIAVLLPAPHDLLEEPASPRGARGACEVSPLAPSPSASSVSTPAHASMHASLHASMQPTGARRGTILLADDEPQLRATVSELLRAIGFDVVEASDGVEAVACYERQRPDVAVLDMTMPGLSGVEALERIRAAHPEAKVILSTGYSERDVPSSPSGAPSGFLQKPYDLDELERTLRGVLST